MQGFNDPIHNLIVKDLSLCASANNRLKNSLTAQPELHPPSSILRDMESNLVIAEQIVAELNQPLDNWINPHCAVYGKWISTLRN